MKSVVYLQACDSYSYESVKVAVDRLFRDAGGISTLFRPNSKVLLKPNLISPLPPDKGATTHPTILRAVIEALKTVTERIYVGDSPAVGRMASVLAKTGVLDVILATGANLADFDTPVSVSHPEGRVMKRFEIAKACMDYDHFVSLPKCKTHCQLMYTGALKNQYGVIPGLKKARGHMQFNTRERFAHMLVDLHIFLKPDFAVMDAVFGIEGDGLKASSPRKIGAILGSADLLALDSITSRILSYDPSRLPVLQEAYERGIGGLKMGDIEQVGKDYRTFLIPDFRKAKAPRSLEHLRFVPGFLRKRIYDSVLSKPHVLPRNCVLCKKCFVICPAQPKAIQIVADRIQLNSKACVLCYCCHEVCENAAVVLKTGVLGRFF